MSSSFEPEPDTQTEAEKEQIVRELDLKSIATRRAYFHTVWEKLPVDETNEFEIDKAAAEFCKRTGYVDVLKDKVLNGIVIWHDEKTTNDVTPQPSDNERDVFIAEQRHELKCIPQKMCDCHKKLIEESG